jgi:carboxymethylenebutenolidase
VCDESPLTRPAAGQVRGPKDRLRADELTSFGDRSAGIVRMPDSATEQQPAPVVVVAPERYGLVQHTVDVAERFAAAGWASISPDFYTGISENEAGRLPELPDEAVLGHIRAAVAHVRADARCDASRVVIFGVCRSGSWGLLASADAPDVRGVIMLYGGAGPREFAVTARRDRGYQEIIDAGRAPVLGIFGERDHTMSLDHVATLRAAFEQSRRSYDITVVPGMPHGWLNDTMPGRFRADVAEQTWTQMLAFLATVAGAPADPAAGAAVTWTYRATVAVDYDFDANIRQE